MIVYRANIGIAARFIVHPYPLSRVLERGGGSPSLLSVAVDFYHRFHPLGQVNDSAEDWPARDPRAADLSKSDPVFFC